MSYIRPGVDVLCRSYQVLMSLYLSLEPYRTSALNVEVSRIEDLPFMANVELLPGLVTKEMNWM